MANDLKLGSLDVADVRFGSTQVSKVMLGSTEVWASGGAPPPTVPTLIDSFSTIAAYTNQSLKPFTVPSGKTIPAGVFLVVGCMINGIWTGVGNMSDNSTQAGAANSYVRRSGSSWQQGSNVTGFLIVCKTTRAIVPGDVITLDHSTSRNRGAMVAGWFTDQFPDTNTNGLVIFSEGASGTTWSTGNQGITPCTLPTLDLILTIGTGAAPPFTFTDSTKIGDALTAAGSADRSVGLGYRVSPAAGNRSASGGLATSAVWGAGLVPVDYTP